MKLEDVKIGMMVLVDGCADNTTSTGFDQWVFHNMFVRVVKINKEGSFYGNTVCVQLNDTAKATKDGHYWFSHKDLIEVDPRTPVSVTSRARLHAIVKMADIDGL